MWSFENGLWLLKYAGRPTPIDVIKWSRKMATDIIHLAKNKGECREREREREREKVIMKILHAQEIRRFFP